MNVFLIALIFNVHTGVTSDPHILANFSTQKDCITRLMDQGARYPDKDGNVVLYECVVPPTRPSVKMVDTL